MIYRLSAKAKLRYLLLTWVVGFMGCLNSYAQVSYWSPLTTVTPFHNSDGLLSCMAYKNGNLYVPYFDYYGHTLYLAVLSNGNWQTHAVPQSFSECFLKYYSARVKK